MAKHKRRHARKQAPKQEPELKQEMLVIFTSPTGRAPWHPLKPEEVPDWVKDPEVMARLVSGEECMDCGVEPAGSSWYRAVRAADINEAMKADH